MRAVCAEAARRGVGGRAPRCPTTTGRTSAGSPGTCRTSCCASRSPTRSATLREIAAAEGTTVRYLKPHGALYHRVIDDEEQARGGARRLRRRCRCSGMPGALVLRAGRGGRAGDVPGGLPGPRRTARTGGCCRATEPGAVLTDADADRRPRGRAGRPRSTRCACTATARVRWPAPRAVRDAALGGRGLGSELRRCSCTSRARPDHVLHRPCARSVEIGRILWTCAGRSVEEPVGPEECRISLPESLARVCPRARRTLPTNSPLAEGWGSRQKQGSTRRGDSPRRPGDGDGGVGGSVRWIGRHTPVKAEGLLMLIPSGAPHLFRRRSVRIHADQAPVRLATPLR